MKTSVVLLATLILAGCAPVTTAPDRTPPENPGEYCGQAPAAATTEWLSVGEDEFAVTTVGEGTTTVVYANTLSRTGCGFWPFAVGLAEQGVRSILVNVCGSALTNCTSSEDRGASDIAALLAVARAARADGAERIVVMGASVNGTVAIGAAAEGGDLFDACASLSGPLAALGVDTLELAPSLTIPIYLASDPNDPTVEPAELEQLKSMLAGEATVDTANTGHGSVMLAINGEPSALVARLAAFVAG